MLLADEPTASLDKASGREVVDRMQSLAKEHGTTILLVTHDNRILDVADRILHLEDGKLSTFTDAVIASTQQLMHTLAESKNRQHLEDLVAGMDEAAFRRTLQDLTQESQRFLQATGRARRGLPEHARAVTARVHAPGRRAPRRRARVPVPGGPRERSSSSCSRPGPPQAGRSASRSRAASPAPPRPPARRSGSPMPTPTRASTAKWTAPTVFRTRSVLCLPLHDRAATCLPSPSS